MSRRSEDQISELLPSRYRFVRTIGRGGQGVVLLVEDRRLGGLPIALKAVIAERPSDEARFTSEFRTLARIAFPGLARVRDFGVLEGGRGWFFTSDYVRGRQLLDWASTRGDGIDDHLIEIADQMLAILVYLEAQGIAHGDVKPQNILVDDIELADERRSNPRVSLVDFGSARGPSSEISPECWSGTLAYSMDGLGADASEARDRHALGLTLFHARVGHLPFALGDEDDRLAWAASGAAARLSLVASDVSRVLDELVTRLTTPQDAGGFSNARAARDWLGRTAGLERNRERRRRAAPAPLVSPVLGREELLERILERIESRISSPGARAEACSGGLILRGPRGLGKESLLDVVRGELQARGVRCISFGSPDDPIALESLTARSDRAPSQPDELVEQLVSRLEAALVVIVAGGDESSSAELRALARVATARVVETPLFVLAACERECAWMPGAEVEEIAPLDELAVAASVSQHFGVATAPPAFVEILLRVSDGVPEELRAALEIAQESATRVDFLGELEIPDDLESRLETGLRTRSRSRAVTVSRLPGEARLAARHLASVSASLRPDELSALFPEPTVAGWERGLEELCWAGLVSRIGSDGPWRFRWRLSAAVPEPIDTGVHSSFAATDLERLASRFPATETSPEWLATLAQLAADNEATSLAFRIALRSLSRFRSQGRLVESFELLRDILRSTRERSGTEDRLAAWFSLAVLKSVDIGVLIGRAAESLELLEMLPADSGVESRFSFARGLRRALLLEQVGRHENARSVLVELNDLLGQDLRPAARVELLARAAELSFTTGLADDARELLSTAVDVATLIDATSRSAADARALDRLGACELEHGDPELAIDRLETSIEIARRLERADELSREPLHRLAVHLARSGLRERAEERFAELEDLYERTGDRLGRLKALYNRSLLAFRDHDFEAAERRFRRAVRLSESMERHPFSATVWIGLATLFREVGKPRDALRLYLRVLRRGSPARPNDRVLARINRADVYQELGFLARSRDERHRATEEARELGNDFLLGVAWRNLSSIEAALGRSSEAEAALEASLAVAGREGTAGVRAPSSARWLGGARFWQALASARSGRDDRNVLRDFFDARRICRRLGDATYAEACELQIVRRLVRAGRVDFSRKIVARHVGDAAAGSRWRPMWRALRCVVAPEPLSAFEDCADILLAEESAGRTWPSFIAWTLLLEDVALGGSERERIVAERERLGARLCERLPVELREPFRLWWSVARVEEGVPISGNRNDQVASSDAATEQDSWREPLLAWSRSPNESLQVALSRALSLLARSFGARAAGIIEPRGLAGVSLEARSEAGAAFGEDLAELLAGPLTPPNPGAVEASETSVRPLVRVSESGLVARFPGGDRALWLRADRGSWQVRGCETLVRDCEVAVGFLELIGRVAGLREDLESARASTRAAQHEARRIQSIVDASDRLPDTAVMTRRGEMFRLESRDRRTLDPSGAPVAASRALRELMSRLPRLAGSDVPILLLGESGVGKDCVARWIHSISPRGAHPLEAEVCSLPDSLLESELFGHVEGAYTGADAGRPGVFERVAGGTLYLDEVTDLSEALQSRLLRVLETRRVRRLGSNEEIELDFRLISSSRVSSESELSERGVRDDLLWRLRGEVLRIPPLRERPEDVLELTRRFVADHARREQIEEPYISPGVIDVLLAHDWPGNVRELFNVLRRALLEDARELRVDPLDLAGSQLRVDASARLELGRGFREARDEFEREFILRTLRHYGGNASRAAEALEITRRYLGKLLEKHSINLRQIKAESTASGNAE